MEACRFVSNRAAIAQQPLQKGDWLRALVLLAAICLPPWLSSHFQHTASANWHARGKADNFLKSAAPVSSIA
jgi:hypothetical protein